MRLMIGAGIDRRGPETGVARFDCAVSWRSALPTLPLQTAKGPPIYVLRILYCSALAGIYGASLTFVSGRAPRPHASPEMVGVLGTAGFLGQVLGTALGDVLTQGETIERWQTDLMFVVARLAGRGVDAVHPASLRVTCRPLVHHERLSLRMFLRKYNPGTVLLVAGAAGLGLCLPQTFLPTYTAELNIPRMGTVLWHLRTGPRSSRASPPVAGRERFGTRADDSAGGRRPRGQPVDVPVWSTTSGNCSCRASVTACFTRFYFRRSSRSARGVRPSITAAWPRR